MSNSFNRINGFPRRNRGNPGDINFNQRQVLDLYMNMYNSTLRQIDSLYEYLSELKHNIDNVVGIEDNYIPNLRENVTLGRNTGVRNNYSILRPHETSENRHNTNDISRNNYDPIDNQHSPSSNNSLNEPNVPINHVSTNNNSVNDIINLLNSYSMSSNLSNDEIIQRATRLLRYSEIENPINDRCPISHELFLPDDEVLQIIPCGHVFNNSEINTWFNQNLHCPVCRHNIRDHLLTTLGNDASGNNILNNDLNRGRFDFRYDMSGNYMLFETFYRRI
jgi:hypothetical protein